jgi:hypothetical protein
MKVFVGIALAMLPLVKPTMERRFTQMTAQDSLIVEEWKKTIMEKKQPLNLDSLSSSARVLIFGENHEKSFQRYLLASRMDEFRNHGYSCFMLGNAIRLAGKTSFYENDSEAKKDGC